MDLSCSQFRWRLPVVILAGALALGFHTRPCAGAETIAEVMDILQQHGIPVDTNAANDAAILGMLKSVDPSAQIVTPEEAERMRKEVLGLSAVPGMSTNTGGVRSQPSVVVSEVRSNGVAYLKLPGLYSGTGAEAAIRLLDMASKAGTCGIILDIRGAGGNDLEAVGEIASLFDGLTNVLYRVRDGSGQEAAVEEHSANTRLKVPLMLLTDRRTTSASEVMAAVLNGRRGVMLIGSPTGGDNRLREMIPLPDGRRLCIASRQIVLPGGSTYDLSGVIPNVSVRDEARTDILSASESTNALPGSARAEKDPVLGRAVDILLGLKALGVHAAGQTADHKD